MAANRRRRSSGVDDIAEAIHRMVDAVLPPVAVQPRMAIAPIRVPTVEDFLCHKPAEFTSKASPDEADAWLRKCEKIFKQQMQTREEEVNWTNFRTRFLEKYLPDTVRQDKEAEFLALQQGDMTVQEHKFERGLKHELKKVVTPLRERRFLVLVKHAKSVEHLKKGPGPVVSRHQKNVAEARQMKKPYSRPQTSQGGVGGSGDRHKCFICNKSGHFANNCPKKKNLGVKKPAASLAERARVSTQVFALTSTEAIKSGQVATSSVCVRCSMEVTGRRFKVNLVCLPLEGLDVILGMDWLSNNHIIIDCGRHSLVFPEHEGLELISSQKAINEVEAGATCFMIMAHVEKNSTAEKISVIPIVEEYVDVFPDEISELPPSRDVDFTIDLIHGAGPVSMAPYRMAPA
ncbi:uncharacterized protein LOC114188310 [Vigna unguiculata]|uniref:uncharacterized protein LOC114188310 n=1 Tax=Vigna unguiculata TaxID=3917 RepID=UPI0010166F56|nr:uncharacterized protein LOC114188310 [Vigna unguiculata]